MRTLGPRWFPLVTAVVFGVTALSNVAQFVVPGMLAHLGRAPAGLHGDWWRTGTSLFVQDGGVAGTVSNLLFLVLVGAVAEQVLSRPRWLLCYFATGLVGEFAGYAWQPHGGGNSVAVCGLAGAVAVALWRGDGRLPRFAPMIVLLWCGALLTGLWFPLALVGFVAAMAVRIAAERGVATGRWATAGALAAGVALTADRDIHGVALLAGLVIASVLVRSVRRLPVPA
ncbi:rhomboid family intramembrane serine protease [Actinoallomurus iriomotensis]|uniref:rhomboid family intramembrane serine protease n=1 Tax=Actinoallomurus iriomotensis TaxID=478107 RepID=UPI002554FC40|nr:rhomboid family intramembrane serine protease [Actinoallomurus iriomotensis]